MDGLQSTYDVIQRTAKNFPEKIAFHFLTQADVTAPSRDISYAEFGAKVTQTANLFHDLGIGPKDVVSYLLPNLPETHYVLWGAEAAGVVNPINPLLDIEHIVAIMTAARSKVLVTLGPNPQSDIWQKAMEVKHRVPTLTHIVQIMGPDQTIDDVIFYQDVINSYNSESLDSGRIIKRDDLCSLFHTGGTTGTPKLAKHTHFKEIANATMASLNTNVSDEDVGLCGLPLFHINAVMVTGLVCFLSGATVVLATAGGYRTEGLIANFWKIIERYRVTFFSGVPTIYAGLLQVPLDGADVSTLRIAICGAAPIAQEVIRKFEAATGLALIEGYGLTEGTCISSCNPLHGERRVGSIGFRSPYQEMKTVILDKAGHYVRDCNTDEIGTVALKGPNVFSGYLQAENNAGIWVADGWLNTGDVGRQDEQGYFWLTGRTKELIIRGGHNIDPAVIENALSKHNDVAHVAAVGKPDSYAGEVPVAYVVLHPGATCAVSELIDFAKDHIAERAAAPKEIYLISALPLTAVGKIFKPELKRNVIKRTILDLLADFNLTLNISVEADKTYGTIATIENVPEDKIDSIRDIMDHYAFHTIINKTK